MTRLQNELSQLIDRCQTETISLDQLFSKTASHNQALLTFILAVPFLLPVPLPGLSIPFGVLMAWIGLRMFLGKSFWLPSYLKNKKVSSALALKIFEKARPLCDLISRWVKPRGAFFSNNPGLKRVCFFLISICGFFLALPLPPGTNAPPALTAALLSLGVLEHDGLYLILGFICFALILGLFISIPLIGYPHVIRWFGY